MPTDRNLYGTHKAPLAARMRPKNLDEFVGQQKILGKNSVLRQAIKEDKFTSLIFYGKAGVGKTTLAEIIAKSAKSRFIRLSAVDVGVAQTRKEIERAGKLERLDGKRATLFIDEIHRFNKAQQDILLPHIENGHVRFVGATTHNPYFYLNSPLISRSLIFSLEALSNKDLQTILQRACADSKRGIANAKGAVKISQAALEHIATMSDGDARKALGALELAATFAPKGKDGRLKINLDLVQDACQKKALSYDKNEDEHYDTISAFIKSIRGGDPDAALYWLAKMLYAGEEIRFIARRMIIAASEDIGMADSNALRVATDCMKACESVGLPEAEIILAHTCVYLACAPKSNRAYMAYLAAKKEVKSGKSFKVPLHLRTKTRKKLARQNPAAAEGADYHYSHDVGDEAHAYEAQKYLPKKKYYYHPSERGQEKRVKERLEHWRKLYSEKFAQK